MNNQVFSKIWIMVIAIAILGGGFFAWQYFRAPKEEAIGGEQELAENMITEFMNARMDRNVNKAKNYLTDNGVKEYSQHSFIDYALVGISNPHYSRFEILEAEKIDIDEFKFVVRIYEYFVETKEKGDFQYFDEELIVIKINNNYLVDSVECGEFIIIEDETADWKTYRNEEYGFEIKYPKEWTFLEVPQYQRVHFYSDGKQRTEFEYMDSGEVTVYYNLEESASEWIKEKAEQEKEISVDSKPAIQYIKVKGGQDPTFPTILSTIVVIEYKERIYSIHFETHRYSTEKNEFLSTIENQEIFNQMLSTFKFLE